jgi:hypothetical protein
MVRYYSLNLKTDPTYQIHHMQQLKDMLIEYTQGEDFETNEVIGQQIDARLDRADDPNAPMTFANLDGSCSANAPLQVLLNIPGISSLVAESDMADAELKAALTDLFSRRASGRACAFATRVLHALGEDQAVCRINDTYDTMLKLVEHIPELSKITELYPSGSSINLESGKVPKLAFLATSSETSGVPLPPVITATDASGQLVTYDLISTLESETGHVFANVRVEIASGGYQWYKLSDYVATKRQFSEVGVGAGRDAKKEQTTMLVYQLRAEPSTVPISPVPANAIE